jgi:septum formation protein
MIADAQPRFILASGSPRRRQLLGELGLSFEVRAVDIDESQLPDEAPDQMVLRLAESKAREGARPGELLLAADTIVVLDGKVLGKPADAAQAAAMLANLGGREHQVLTGVALVDGQRGEVATGLESSQVRIGTLDPATIDWYVGTGEPLDKAGSYGIQGLGAMLVETVSGNYTNVVGLPLPLVRRLFGELGHDLLSFRAAETATHSPQDCARP